MIARPVRALVSLVAVLLAVACTNSFEIPIETPIRPKLDVAAFQRVLVAGFIAVALRMLTVIERRCCAGNPYEVRTSRD
jgi:hypothetical protein